MFIVYEKIPATSRVTKPTIGLMARCKSCCSERPGHAHTFAQDSLKFCYGRWILTSLQETKRLITVKNGHDPAWIGIILPRYTCLENRRSAHYKESCVTSLNNLNPLSFLSSFEYPRFGFGESGCPALQQAPIISKWGACSWWTRSTTGSANLLGKQYQGYYTQGQDFLYPNLSKSAMVSTLSWSW